MKTLLIFSFVLVATLCRVAEGQQHHELAAHEVPYFVTVYANHYSVPVELAEAVIEVESGWNPFAVSPKGACGLMQLMPATAQRFGVLHCFDETENVRGGIAYLAWLLRLFRGDPRLAVAAYQAGEARIVARGLKYSSQEVFQYVARVAQVYRRLRWQAARRLGLRESAYRTAGLR